MSAHLEEKKLTLAVLPAAITALHKEAQAGPKNVLFFSFRGVFRLRQILVVFISLLRFRLVVAFPTVGQFRHLALAVENF